MQIYLVGGAVRDQLLGRPVTERDWVVVGARPDDLLQKNFRAVGRDFPVFLHPDTQEEYALARMERKSGSGHTGFICDFSPHISLEEDLLRRDLTINAIAQADDGRLIDPYGGQRDIQARLLRHVSPAFREDPLRVFRVARFAARYHALGFRVADETLALMQHMVTSGELQQLTPERVWKETEKALSEASPRTYIDVLRACGALAIWFPEIDRLFGVPQRAEYHPEIDTGIHTLMCVDIATQLSPSAAVRFAALVHDLGKADTPPAEWPRHIGHEGRGVRRVRELSERLKVPRYFADLGELVSRYHLDIHRADELRASTVLRKLLEMDALRRPDRFEDILLACEADARGRLGFSDKPYPSATFWRAAQATLKQVSPQPLLAQGLQGPDFIQALEAARLAALQSFHQHWQAQHGG